MKVEESYEIANIMLTLESEPHINMWNRTENHYCVVVRKGGQVKANFGFRDDYSAAQDQYNMLEELIPALIAG